MPVYTFQVGGSPFPSVLWNERRSIPNMEKGNIYASYIASTRGEFVGLGSLPLTQMRKPRHRYYSR